MRRIATLCKLGHVDFAALLYCVSGVAQRVFILVLMPIQSC